MYDPRVAPVPAGTGAAMAPRQRRTLSVLALIFGGVSLLCSCVGLLGLLFAIAGVVFGIIAIRRGERNGMSVVGLILGLLGLLLGAAVLAAMLSIGPKLLDMSARLERGEITPEEFSRWLENLYAWN